MWVHWSQSKDEFLVMLRYRTSFHLVGSSTWLGGSYVRISCMDSGIFQEANDAKLMPDSGLFLRIMIAQGEMKR